MTDQKNLDSTLSGQSLRYAVVVSEFNSFITDQLLRGALQTLKSHNVPAACIEVVHVPAHMRFQLRATCWRRRDSSMELFVWAA
jgi:6,7-dimethyl-8-ribityllumazine synthase